MSRRNQTGLALACAGLLALGGILAASFATSSRNDQPWNSWGTVRMHAKAFPLFSGSLEMRRTTESGRVRLETRTTARFLGARVAESRTVTVIDPTTGKTREYRSRSKKRGREYRFGESGYTVERLSAEKSRRGSSPEWVVTSRADFDYPVNEDGSRVTVFDYYGMLLHLRDVELHRPNDEVVLYVATAGGPEPYRIRVAEIRSDEYRFTDLRRGEKRTMPVRMLRLRIIPADPEKADEGFLKMEGEAEIWVEAESKTVMLLSGKVPKVPGRVRLKLTEIG